MTQAIGRVDRDTQVILETLALFIRFELSIQVPLAEKDHAGRALAAKRFEAFGNQVGRHLASGSRTPSATPEQQRRVALQQASDPTRWRPKANTGRASCRTRAFQNGETTGGP